MPTVSKGKYCFDLTQTQYIAKVVQAYPQCEVLADSLEAQINEKSGIISDQDSIMLLGKQILINKDIEIKKRSDNEVYLEFIIEQKDIALSKEKKKKKWYIGSGIGLGLILGLLL